MVYEIAATIMHVLHESYKMPVNVELDVLTYILNHIFHLCFLVVFVELFSTVLKRDETMELISERLKLSVTVLSYVLACVAICLYSRQVTGGSIFSEELTFRLINQFLFLLVPVVIIWLRVSGIPFGCEPIDKWVIFLGIWLSGKPIVKGLVRLTRANQLAVKSLVKSIVFGFFVFQFVWEGYSVAMVLFVPNLVIALGLSSHLILQAAL